jgi:hypothetical protein
MLAAFLGFVGVKRMSTIRPVFYVSGWNRYHR